MLSKINVLIVDDEPLALRRMQRLLAQIEDVAVIATATNGDQALKLVLEHEPDIVFLDIEMPIMGGLEAAKQIYAKCHPSPAVIFCTAYSDFAIDAFKTSASDYLLKPVDVEQLRSAIAKASMVTQLQYVSAQQKKLTSSLKLNVSRNSDLVALEITDVVYVRSENKLTIAGLKSGEETVINYSLQELHERFDDELLRVHRSTLLNRSYLKELCKDDAGKYSLNVDYSNKIFDVSRRHLTSVKESFKQL